jgi:hypothetical protein
MIVFHTSSYQTLSLSLFCLADMPVANHKPDQNQTSSCSRVPCISGQVLNTIEELAEQECEATLWSRAATNYEALCVVGLSSLGQNVVRPEVMSRWLTRFSVCLTESCDIRARAVQAKLPPFKNEAQTHALYEAKSYEAALVAYMALADSPDARKNPALESRRCARVALCYHHLKFSRRALPWASRALAVGNGAGARISENWNVRAMCYDGSGDTKSALSDYTHALLLLTKVVSKVRVQPCIGIVHNFMSE